MTQINKACPFCGHKHPEAKKDACIWRVWCMNVGCMADGPARYSEKEAIMAWERRVVLMKEKEEKWELAPMG